MVASVLIALGVLMLMQPYRALGLHLFLYRHAGGHGDVHHRQPFSGVSDGGNRDLES